jgi:ATP-dependent Clp protease ATP-binding subunit ClpA
VFHPLERGEIRKIVDLQIKHLEQLLADRDLGLEVTDKARQEIANRGYDPTYGARPLKRVIQQEIQNPLATETAPTSRSWPSAAATAHRGRGSGLCPRRCCRKGNHQ